MSDFLFFYPKHYFDSTLMERAFFARRGRVPTASSVRVESFSTTRDVVRCSTSLDVSGSFYVPCVDRRSGAVFASTETLASTPRPRSLLVELARGQLSRALKKRADWTIVGLRAPLPLRVALRRAAGRFATLATSDVDAPGFDDESVATFETLREIGLRWNDLFLEQAMASRQTGVGAWDTTLGFATTPTPDFFESYWGRRGSRRGERSRRRGLGAVFQSFHPTIGWTDVEKEEGRYDWTAFDRALDWAEERGLRTTLGPLIRWDRRATPRWLLGRPDENDGIVSAFRRFVDAALARDRGRTTRWIVATNVEKDNFGPPSEVRLDAATETARKIELANPDAETFLGFEQPFGDGARFRTRSTIAPIEFASKIARRREFSGFYLEMNFGLSKRATAPRDPMEWHRFFDQWAALGARLCVAASYPSAAPSDGETLEFPSSSFVDLTWRRLGWGAKKDSGATADDLLTRSPEARADAEPAVWSEKTQQENARRFLLTALARRSVDEIVWSRLFDAPVVDGDFDDEPSETTAFDLDDSRPGDAPPFVLRDAGAETADDFADETTRADDARGRETKRRVAETVETAAERRAAPFELFPTSGLIGLDGRPKPAFHKLAALKRAYFD